MIALRISGVVLMVVISGLLFINGYILVDVLVDREFYVFGTEVYSFRYYTFFHYVAFCAAEILLASAGFALFFIIKKKMKTRLVLQLAALTLLLCSYYLF